MGPDDGVLAYKVAGAEPVQGQPAVGVLALHRQLVVPVLRFKYRLPLQTEMELIIGLCKLYLIRSTLLQSLALR